MTVLSGDPTTGRQSFEAQVPVAELHCFARDLGGSTLHVVVAAAGRALGWHPDVAGSLAGDGVDAARIGIRVDPERIAVVREASTAPLPQLRDEVDRVVGAARRGRLTGADTGEAPITVVDHGTAGLRDAPIETSGCLLEAEPVADDPQALRLTLEVDPAAIRPEDATRLLETLVRLLSHPYRRLV